MSWLPRQVPPKSFGDEWKGLPFGAMSHYQLRLDPMGPRGSEFITLAAQADNVDIYLEIPYPHRWCRMEFKHTDASDVGSNTTNSFEQSRNKWLQNNPFYLYHDPASVSEDDMRIAGEGYECPPSKYRLRVTGTENYRIYPEFTIQILGSPKAASQMKGKEFIQ